MLKIQSKGTPTRYAVQLCCEHWRAEAYREADGAVVRASYCQRGWRSEGREGDEMRHQGKRDPFLLRHHPQDASGDSRAQLELLAPL